ncbi:MAG: hypothetical protein IH944_02625 [Armatimonadetes bacterium]|nr:hypothetical protein [Armatimonadota bacterium]
MKRKKNGDEESKRIDRVASYENLAKTLADESARSEFEDTRHYSALRQSLLGEQSESGVEFELLEQYVNGTADDVTREIVQAHMASDPTVRQEVEELLELRGKIELGGQTALSPKPSKKGRASLTNWVFGSFGAVGMAAAAATLLFIANPRSERINGLESEVAILGQESDHARSGFEAALEEMQKNIDEREGEIGDLNVRIGDLNEALEGATPESVFEQAGARYVRSANGLIEKREPASESVLALLSGRAISEIAFTVPVAVEGGVSRGGDLRAVGLTPIQSKVPTDKPVFQWEPVEGAVRVQVVVETIAGQPVITSPWLDGEQWTCSIELEPGVTYQWYLNVEDSAGGIELATVRDELPATFEIGQPAEWDKVGSFTLGEPTLEGFGWLLERGYLEGAEEVLAKLIAANPDDPELGKWQRELSRMSG